MHGCLKKQKGIFKKLSAFSQFPVTSLQFTEHSQTTITLLVIGMFRRNQMPFFFWEAAVNCP